MPGDMDVALRAAAIEGIENRPRRFAFRIVADLPRFVNGRCVRHVWIGAERNVTRLLLGRKRV